MEKGHELEVKIERSFQLYGYKTERNVILEGKSGGKHEIDILAEKSDGVTTMRIMVECKAWDRPIEKDVVSKVHYVKEDLGLNKAIIVALSGWRIGAEKSARELGIDLWGRDELEKRLGRVEVAELETIEFKKIVVGARPIISEDSALRLIEKERRGILGLGKEEVEFAKLVWVPCYLFQISHAKAEGIIRKKIRTKTIWDLYDALEGFLLYMLGGEPRWGEIEAGNVLQSKIKDREIKRALQKSFEKAREVVTPKAKRRYAKKLAELGIPLPVTNISVEDISRVYYPFYVALLRKGEKRRLVAVDAVQGNLHKTMSGALTMNLDFVVSSVA